ncbi:hypothetical protein [Flavisolibacter nicotianae]|uniref:hypothetical protein n=1 Tax=Flavisolibacter nicotianae TaxID=2364882 RepID=UPI000EB22B7E|nr:hypothetical protein [Flavisolibacter nicotianae]
MKKMLLTATALGTAIAGLIVYYQRKNKSSNRVLESADDAYKTINEGIGHIERPAHHAMG